MATIHTFSSTNLIFWYIICMAGFLDVGRMAICHSAHGHPAHGVRHPARGHPARTTPHHPARGHPARGVRHPARGVVVLLECVLGQYLQDVGSRF